MTQLRTNLVAYINNLLIKHMSFYSKGPVGRAPRAAPAPAPAEALPNTDE